MPTPPVYKTEPDPNTGAPVNVVDADGNYAIFSGEDPNRGVAAGMFGSFSDAPGIVYVDGDGVQHVEPGSQFKEELREFYYGGGLNTGTPSNSPSAPAISGRPPPRAIASTSPWVSVLSTASSP